MGNKTLNRFIPIVLFTYLFGCNSCDDKGRKIDVPKPTVTIEHKFERVHTPEFDDESAFRYVQKQVDFGPRVPNNDAHNKCAKWLQDEIKNIGLELTTQEGKVTAYNGAELSIYNIMGRFKPDASRRILLCAHWDSRPYADRDTKDQNKPIDGANDGASGVGVLLELARVISQDSVGPKIGFDILFFDAEDYGKPEGSMVGESSDSWCLGSQYWCDNVPIENYKPEYGILLDMVGASNAVFPKEGVSTYYARDIVNKVWNLAANLGYKNVFVPFEGGQITDDHAYLNTKANIKTIDIIHYELSRTDFGRFHHTHNDNISVIDPKMLGTVGDVLLQLIYTE